MASSIHGKHIFGMVLLLAGLAFGAGSVHAGQADSRVEQCLSAGGQPSVALLSKRFRGCFMSFEESERRTLECIRAGGRPVTDWGYGHTGAKFTVYETCAAPRNVSHQQGSRQRTTRPQYKSSVPDLPVTFEPRDRGQSCQTRRTGSNSYSTTCSPR